MDTASLKRTIDTAIGKARDGFFEQMDRRLSEIHGELAFLNADRRPRTAGSREIVAHAIAERGRRYSFFEQDLFADPAWDVLLALALAKFDGRHLAIKEVTLATVVPATTALRWLSVLELHELVERYPDLEDRRRTFVRLSADGWARILRWVDSTAARDRLAGGTTPRSTHERACGP